MTLNLIVLWLESQISNSSCLLFNNVIKYHTLWLPIISSHLSQYIDETISPKWSTNPIAITRIFSHWPTGVYLIAIINKTQLPNGNCPITNVITEMGVAHTVGLRPLVFFSFGIIWFLPGWSVIECTVHDVLSSNTNSP